jgi:hypothetical protein
MSLNFTPEGPLFHRNRPTIFENWLKPVFFENAVAHRNARLCKTPTYAKRLPMQNARLAYFAAAAPTARFSASDW